MTVWTNAVTGLWSDTTKWTGGIIPNALGASAQFTTTLAPGVATTYTISLSTLTRKVGTLQLESTATDTYSISNGTLDMDNGAGTATIITSFFGAGVMLTSTLAANLTLQLTSDTIIATSAGTTLDVLSQVTGAGSITKTGTGTLRFNDGTNNWSGGLAISAGKVLATAASVLGGTTSVAAGAILDLGGFTQQVSRLSGAGSITNSNSGAGAGAAILSVSSVGGATTFSGVMSDGSAGALGLTKTLNGTLILSGDNTYTGTTTIAGGTLQIGDGGATGTLGTGNVTNNGTLEFNRTGANFAVSNVISGTGSVVQNNAGLLSLTGANTYSGGTTIGTGFQLNVGNNIDAGSLGTGDVANAGSLRFVSGANQIVTNAISGTGALAKVQGGGTLILSGANTYTGITAINAGTLQIGNGGATGTLGTGAVTNNFTLAFNRSNNLSVSNAISGAGTLVKDGAGTLFLLGANTYAGTTTINTGTLNVGGGFSTGTLGTGNVTNNATLEFARSNDLTVSNVISGAGALVKSGVNVLTLTGANTYSGTTTINAGTLQIGNGGATGTLGTGDVVNNGVLAFNRSGVDFTVSGVISGTGAVVLNLSGTTDLILTGANTYSGGTTIGSSAALKVGDGILSGSLGTGAVTNNEVLFFNTGVAGLHAANAISGSGQLVKIGLGTTILSGANSYAGNTTINFGTLQIGNGGATGTLGTGNIVIDHAATLAFNRSNAVGVVGLIAGGGSVVKDGAGTLTLSAAHTYLGGTTINAGAILGSGTGLGTGGVTVNAGGILGLVGNLSIGALSGAGAILNNDPAIGRTLTQTNNIDTLFSGVATNGFASLALSKSGAGKLTLSGANTYTGITFINAGTLALSGAGSIANSAVINMGSGGATFDISGIAGTQASIRHIAFTDASDLVQLGGKKLVVTNGVNGTAVGTYVGSGATDGLIYNLDAGGGSLDFSTLTFTNWTDGDDQITINANALANTITGSSHADIINAGNGDDTLIGGAAGSGAFNQLNGDAGNDTASYAGTVGNVFADILNSNAGTINGVLIDVYTSIENLIGGFGNDTLLGNNNANRLSGDIGDDLLFGQDGDDTLIGGAHVGGSFNQLFGGNGADTADYSAETGRVFVDLRAPAGHIDNGGGFILNDLMNSIENVLGSANDDTIVGTDADNNLLLGNGGTDLLFGLGGNDTLIGGGANAGQYNQLFGDTGNDTVSYLGTTFGVFADLNIFAGYVKNGAGTLILTDVYNQVENLTGGSVADTLVGNIGANILNGGAGADILYANFDANAPTVHDTAIDTFVYNAGSESTLGSGFDQIVNFTSGQDLIDLRALNINAGQVTLNNNGGSWSVFANTDGIAGIGNNDLAILVQSSVFTMGDILFV